MRKPFSKIAYIIDDDAGTLSLLKGRLAEAGFTVNEFETIAAFTEKWGPGAADVIVTDWKLRGAERGEQVFRTVRARDWEVPLILVSSKLSESDPGKRVDIFQELLANQNTQYIERNSTKNTIAFIAKRATETQTRRDPLLVESIGLLRKAASQGEGLKLASGTSTPQKTLARLLGSPAEAKRHEQNAINEVTKAWRRKK